MFCVELGFGLALVSTLGLGSGRGLALGLELALMSASKSAFYTFDISIRTSAFYPWPRGSVGAVCTVARLAVLDRTVYHDRCPTLKDLHKNTIRKGQKQ